MKAKLSNYYRKQGGLMVFVYIVIGSLVELAAYAVAQGVNLRKNEKDEPLFFSTRPLSTNRAELIPLTITTTGRVVADDLSKILTQEAKFDDYVLQEKAKITAQLAVGRGGIETLSNAMATRPVATEAEIEEVLDNAIDVLEDANIQA